MLRLFNIVSALAAFIICIFSQRGICNEYSMIIVLPILYLVFSFILGETIRQRRKNVYRTTGWLLIGLQWLRCVLSPALGALCGYYSNIGSHIDSDAASLAVCMLIYETMAVFIFACFAIRFSGQEKDVYRGELMTLSGDVKIYALFILFAFGLMIITRNVPFQFFALSSGTSTRLVLQENSNLALDTVIMYGLTFLVIIVIAEMHKKYLVSDRELYLNIALIAIVIRVSLISSESRLALVYQIGTGLMLMIKMFPKKRKKTVRILLIAAIAVIGLLTIYKVFYAFMFDSYLQALASRTNFSLLDISAQLDAYFYGVKTVARNFSYVRSSSDASLLRWLLDIVRNTFGVHYAFRGNTKTTIEAYNLYVYSGRATSGYLFSSIAYGYMYYGIVFAPVSTIINFILACMMEKRIRSICHIEIYYIMCLAYIRFAVSQFAVFGATWNYVSRTLVIGMFVIGLASIGRLKSKSRVYIGNRLYDR